MKLDDKDERILAILKNNARTPNVEIARQVHLTEGAVRHRIETLLAKGAIKNFTIETSSGETFFGVVMVKAKGETKKMMEAIAATGSIKDGYEISGEYDGCLVVEGVSLEDVDRKIDTLRKLKNVKDTKTFVSFGKW
jgi:DNA-binding Lrp family transcriptional regulator